MYVLTAVVWRRDIAAEGDRGAMSRLRSFPCSISGLSGVRPRVFAALNLKISAQPPGNLLSRGTSS
jgi:hypothetical protein